MKVKWRERKHVEFDNSKNKIIYFTRPPKSDPKRKTAEARKIVTGHSLRFNTASPW